MTLGRQYRLGPTLFVVEPLARDTLVSLGLFLIFQRGFDNGKMALNGGASGSRIAGLQGVIYRAVLVQKRVAGGALFEHHLAVVKHAFT